MAMLPRTIQMKPGIVPAGLVTDPLVSVHVGSFGVSRFIGKMALRRSGVGSRPGGRSVANRRGAAARGLTGRVVVRRFAATFFLGEARSANGKQRNREKYGSSFHGHLI